MASVISVWYGAMRASLLAASDDALRGVCIAHNEDVINSGGVRR